MHYLLYLTIMIKKRNSETLLILLDKNMPENLINLQCAEVVKLVDTLGSGSSERTLIGVQIPSSVPCFYILIE